MWVFYLISLPLTVGMVIFTLRYFAGPEVRRYVLFIVGYAWFCSLSIIILVPADIWTTIIGRQNGGIAFFWSWSYWSTFLLTWVVVPLIQGFEDAGDFTVTERLKTSIHANLMFYLLVGSVGLFGLFLLVMMRKDCEIPKSIWRNADWTTRQKVLSHKISKMAVKLDDAHQELSNAIVVAQATSKQVSKRDPLRPYMDVIDNMLVQMFREDPSFKPQGGQLGENDMDYDADEKSMATLRRHLRVAREEYYRYKSEYMKYVMEALELEDTIKNHEHCSATGWKFISSLRPDRTGKLGPLFDTAELIWRCIVWKQLKKLLAIVLGCMSAAILLAEATLLPSVVNLSLFSILIKAVGKEEVLVQVSAFVPLMYMCVCTYYSLFKVGMLMFYSLTPRQTSSIKLLMICSMVARYAPPISYNFLNLIRLDEKTIFEKRMGNIDDAVPFFDDMDGFDPSGVLILQKERTWIEQGHEVGEHVIPLARNFNSVSIDVESGSNSSMDRKDVEMKATTDTVRGEVKGSSSKPKHEVDRYSGSREAISNKYAAIREQSRQASKKAPAENISSTRVTLLEAGNSESGNTPSSGLASKWASMKSGFQNFKANMEAKKFLPLRQLRDGKLISRASSSESLDDIFQRLKRPAMEHENNSDDEDEESTEISSESKR